MPLLLEALAHEAADLLVVFDEHHVHRSSQLPGLAMRSTLLAEPTRSFRRRRPRERRHRSGDPTTTIVPSPRGARGGGRRVRSDEERASVPVTMAGDESSGLDTGRHALPPKTQAASQGRPTRRSGVATRRPGEDHSEARDPARPDRDGRPLGRRHEAERARQRRVRRPSRRRRRRRRGRSPLGARATGHARTRGRLRPVAPRQGALTVRDEGAGLRGLICQQPVSRLRPAATMRDADRDQREHPHEARRSTLDARVTTHLPAIARSRNTRGPRSGFSSRPRPKRSASSAARTSARGSPSVPRRSRMTWRVDVLGGYAPPLGEARLDEGVRRP